MVRRRATVAMLSLIACCKSGELQNAGGGSRAGGARSVSDTSAAGGTLGSSVGNANAAGGTLGSGGQDAGTREDTPASYGGWQGGQTGTGGPAGGGMEKDAAYDGEGTATTSSSGGSPGGDAWVGASGDAGRDLKPPGDAAGEARTCVSLPAVMDYGAPGPFSDAKMFTNVGPKANYTLFRADATLGQNGFLHPVAAWGNGISTTPDMYQKTLKLIASHGFVVIACNDTQAEEPCLSAGLDWLIEQDTATGPMKGKLDTKNEVVIGYSWGGGAAIDTSGRPNVRATVSLHGMPPRESPWPKAHAPLLLFTSTGDNFVTAAGYVTPNYEASTVQTFYATLNDSSAGHLYVVDELSGICIGSILGSTFGNCGNGELEHAPTIAWLRMWACGDTKAKPFFYGDSCTLCQSPWTNPQRKNWQ